MVYVEGMFEVVVSFIVYNSNNGWFSHRCSTFRYGRFSNDTTNLSKHYIIVIKYGLQYFVDIYVWLYNIIVIQWLQFWWPAAADRPLSLHDHPCTNIKIIFNYDQILCK